MNNVTCTNWLCVYQKWETCILGKIEIDLHGCCRNFIVVNIGHTYLNKHKENQLKYLPNYMELLFDGKVYERDEVCESSEDDGII